MMKLIRHSGKRIKAKESKSKITMQENLKKKLKCLFLYPFYLNLMKTLKVLMTSMSVG